MLDHGARVLSNKKNGRFLPDNTACLEVMDDEMIKTIKPGKRRVRECDNENLCFKLNVLSINQMIVKFKLLEV